MFKKIAFVFWIAAVAVMIFFNNSNLSWLLLATGNTSLGLYYYQAYIKVKKELDEKEPIELEASDE